MKRAGITETPKTLDELLEVCQKLQDAGMTPISAGNYDMVMRYPAFKAFRLEGNDFIDNARTGEKKFNSDTGIKTAQYAQDIMQYFSEGWTSSDATAQMELFLNRGAAMLYTGSWDTLDLADENGELKDDISMFKLPVDTEGTATGENDYYANCGIGTAIRVDAMNDQMKDFISYVWDNFADTAMYDYNMLPSMMPSDPESLPELTQQILSDLDNCGTFAQCWMYAWIRLPMRFTERNCKPGTERADPGRILPAYGRSCKNSTLQIILKQSNYEEAGFAVTCSPAFLYKDSEVIRNEAKK